MTFNNNVNDLHLCSYHTDNSGNILCLSYFYIYRVADREEPLANLVKLYNDCHDITVSALTDSYTANNNAFYESKIVSAAIINGDLHGDWNSVRNGLWLQYSYSNRPQTKGYFVKGLRQGEFITVADDGSYIGRANYRDNLLDGHYESVERGRLKESGNYSAGKKQGDFITVTIEGYTDHVSYRDNLLDGYYQRVEDTTGRVMETGYYSADLKTGLWQTNYFTQYGNFSSIGHYIIAKVGHWIEYHPASQEQHEGDYVDGVRVGPWTETNVASGEVTTGDYSKGVRSGIWSTRTRDGELIAEANYFNGQRFVTYPTPPSSSRPYSSRSSLTSPSSSRPPATKVLPSPPQQSSAAATRPTAIYKSPLSQFPTTSSRQVSNRGRVAVGEVRKDIKDTGGIDRSKAD